MSAKRFAILAVLVAGVFGLGIVVVGLRLWQLGREEGTLRNLPTSTVLQQIHTLSELVSVQYTLEKVVIFEDPKYWGGLIPLGDNRLILLAHGVVKAGVNLGRVQPEDVRVTGRKISLTIPRAAVTDAYLVEHKTRVVDWKTGLLRSFDKDLEQVARRDALVQIQQAARQAGIEADADTRARTQVASFLKLAGFTNVEVQTRQPLP